MNDNGFSAENKTSRRKISFSWIWILATSMICAFFIFASVPGVIAQGRQNRQEGQEDSYNSRRHATVIQQVLDFIHHHYVDEIDPQVVFEGAMNGIFESLGDPYSVFMSEAEMKDINDTTQGTFGGVGLFITKPVADRLDGRPPFVEVASPIEDTPGWRAGINPGDLIISINGEQTDKLTMEEVLARLRGTPGVTLELVIRRGERLEFPVNVTRAIIEVPTVKYSMIEDVGYLKLLTFTPMTVERTVYAINKFKESNYSGLILDLRNNYGGLLNSAVDISNLFLDGGVIVRTKSRMEGESHVFTAQRSSLVDKDIPIVVLINRGSASASEIVAGALKDRGRAYLVGEKSFGKGSVQQVYPLDKAGFKITTAYYYTPTDVNINKIGIPPDRTVLFPEMSDADAEKLLELINDDKIPQYIKNNPQASAAQIEAFARSLEREYGLDLPLLKRFIRNEQNRTVIAPVYDLEYDVQLQEAVKILNSGEFNNLMQTTKSLKALQEEALEEMASAS